MEHSERKWVLCCVPQPLKWVFLNMFLNTVWDFTTCPSFGLHPALHSFILFTLMLFSLTAWLPLLCMSRSLITFLAFTCTSLHSFNFIHLPLFLSLSLSIQLWHHSHLPLPTSSVMLCLLPLLFSMKMKKIKCSEVREFAKHTSPTH